MGSSTATSGQHEARVIRLLNPAGLCAWCGMVAIGAARANQVRAVRVRVERRKEGGGDQGGGVRSKGVSWRLLAACAWTSKGCGPDTMAVDGSFGCHSQHTG